MPSAMSALPKHVLTSTDYLALERATETRSEFFEATPTTSLGAGPTNG